MRTAGPRHRLPAARAREGHRRSASGSDSGPTALRLNRYTKPTWCTIRFLIPVHYSVPVDSTLGDECLSGGVIEGRPVGQRPDCAAAGVGQSEVTLSLGR
jgi:hypothetical protein